MKSLDVTYSKKKPGTINGSQCLNYTPFSHTEPQKKICSAGKSKVLYINFTQDFK